MWQRFTERARRIVFFAQEEAGRLGENYVSTEHLLLGLVREDDSVAARVLNDLGYSVSQVYQEVQSRLTPGKGPAVTDIQLTPRAKQVIDLAYDEARRLNNNYIGTEHILLGLIREDEGTAARILKDLGMTLESVRGQVELLQDQRAKEKQEEQAAGRSAEQLRRRIGDLLGQLFEEDPGLRTLSDTELVAALTRDKYEPLQGEDTAEGAPYWEQRSRFGDLGVINPPEGREEAEFARSAEAFLELRAAFLARDAHGYRELLAAPAGGPSIEAPIVLLPKQTQVKILMPVNKGSADISPLRVAENGAYVRVLDGDYAGQAGWIFKGVFSRTGADGKRFPPPNELL